MTSFSFVWFFILFILQVMSLGISMEEDAQWAVDEAKKNEYA